MAFVIKKENKSFLYIWRRKIMAKNKDALHGLKMQAANEVNVPLKQSGYNGDLTAKQVGSVGGQMVRKMIENYENSGR